MPPDEDWPEPDPPKLTAAAASPAAPAVDEDDSLYDAWVEGVRLVGAWLDAPEMVDLRLVSCDVSGLTAERGVARRVHLQSTRLRGVSWGGGQVDDVLVEDCTTEELSLRFSRLRRVVFRGCRLAGLDCTGALLERALFDSCDLTGAVFREAGVTSLRFRNCDLSGVQGALRLRGAEVDLDDLPGLAPSLASEAGLVLRDPSRAGAEA